MNRTAVGLLLLLVPVCVTAQVPLTGGKSIKLTNKPGNERDSASVKFTNEIALIPPVSPLCPTESFVRLSPSNGEERIIPLDCALWKASGSSFKYSDRAGSRGGVVKITYKAGKLGIMLKGLNYTGIGGPLTSMEVGFGVGDSSFCGRFTSFAPSNTSLKVAGRGPSTVCAPPTPTPTPFVEAECPVGFDCSSFDIQPGFTGSTAVDDGHTSWFRITNLAGFLGLTVDNGTNGQLSSDHPLLIAKSQTTDGNGRAIVKLVQPVVIGAGFPSAAGLPGSVCFRIEQDPANDGWIDCNGGSGADASIAVDSNGTGVEAAPVFTLAGADAGAGATVLRVRLQAATTSSNSVPCSAADFSSSRVISTAFTTATASTQITELRQNVASPTNYPSSTATTTLAGVDLSCGAWLASQTGSIAAPLFALDSVNPALGGTFDLAEVLRLEISASVPSFGTPTETPTASVTPTRTLTPTVPAFACPNGSTCAAFDIVPGASSLLPTDDGTATWLRIFDFTGSGIFANATNGQFGPNPIILAKGANAGNGVAPLTWVGTSYLGANLVNEAQQLGQQGTICVRIQQDPSNTGWVDCDGGTNANASLSVDSNLGNPPPPNPVPVLNVPGAPDGAAAAGSGIVRVLAQFVVLPANNANCSTADYSSSPAVATAFTTATATSTVLNDWVNGSGPESQGLNTTSLSGVALTCAGWGSGTGSNSSIAAPLFGLDFTAPVVNAVVDVAQVFRLNLQPRALPNPNDTPTPLPSSTRTHTPTHSPTQTPTDTVPAATATETPSSTPTHTPTNTGSSTPTSTASTTPSNTPSPTETPTETPFPTCTIVPTSTPPSTPTGTIVSGVAIVNSTSNFGPTGATFTGNCRTQGKSDGQVTQLGGTSFTTRLGSNVADDCETTLADDNVSLATNYRVDFAVTCPAGWTYQLNVSTALVGNMHIHGDENESCSGAASTGVDSTASVSAVAGTNSAGTVTSGSLGLASPGSLTGNNNHDLAVNATGAATIVGAGTGSPINQSLTFTWTSNCSSQGNAGSQGAECQVALGSATDLGCWNSGYPGTLNTDGHFVTVTAQCLFPTPTPVPPCTAPIPTNTKTPTYTPTHTSTVSPTGPSVTPTVTPTVTITPTSTATRTPTATFTPLGTLNFLVIAGPGGSDTSPGCPSDSSNGSYLKTDGGPTGGVPGTICNGTKGHFQSFPANTPLQLVGGIPDANGVASLTIAAPVVIGSDLPTTTPNCGSSCEVCWRFEQDSTPGFVDCDGGSNADVNLIIDSNDGNAPPAPSNGSYVLGSSNSGAGAAVIRTIVKRKRFNGSSSCPAASDSSWNTPDSTTSALLVTGTALSRIDDPHVCSGNNFGTACPDKDPFQASLTGNTFSCASWTSQTGKKLIVPFQNLEEGIGGSFSNGDIAQVLRIQN